MGVLAYKAISRTDDKKAIRKVRTKLSHFYDCDRVQKMISHKHNVQFSVKTVGTTNVASNTCTIVWPLHSRLAIGIFGNS